MYPNSMMKVSVKFWAVGLATIGLRLIPGCPALFVAFINPAVSKKRTSKYSHSTPLLLKVLAVLGFVILFATPEFVTLEVSLLVALWTFFLTPKCVLPLFTHSETGTFPFVALS